MLKPSFPYAGALLAFTAAFVAPNTVYAQELGTHFPASCQSAPSGYGTLDQYDHNFSQALGGVPTSTLCGPVCAANVIAKLRKRAGAPKPVLEDAVELTMLLNSMSPNLLTKGTGPAELGGAVQWLLKQEGIPAFVTLKRVGESAADLSEASKPDTAVIVLLQSADNGFAHYVHVTGPGAGPNEFKLSPNSYVGEDVQVTPGVDNDGRPRLRVRSVGDTDPATKFGIGFILTISLLPHPK